MAQECDRCDQMLKRTMTAIIGLPILIFLIVMGGMWLRILLLALSLVGLYEFYNALSKKVLAIHFTGYIFSVLYFLVIIEYGVHVYLLIMLLAFILITKAMLVIFYQKIDFKDCLITICGFFYVPFLLSFIYFVRDSNVYFVWLILISASASDTFAYMVGRMCGRHKLVGTPSPGKTWEGCIGGVIGAGLVGFIYVHLAAHFTGTNLPMMIIMAVSIMGAIFSQFGDLYGSAIKRYAGIKDFGKILPGHGGVLDRIDSVIVAAPVVYMVMIWMLSL